MKNYDDDNLEVLTEREVRKATSLSKSGLSRGEASGDFPKSIQLSERRKGWLRHEVTEWLRKKMEARSL